MSGIEKKYLVNPNASQKVKRLIDREGKFARGRRKTDYNYALIAMWGNIMPMLLANSLSSSFPWVYFISFPLQLLALGWMIMTFLKAPTKRDRTLKRAQRSGLIIEIPPKLFDIYKQKCQEIGVSPTIANLQEEFAVIKEQLLPALAELEGCQPQDTQTHDHIQRYLEQQLGKVAQGQRLELARQQRHREIEAQALRERQEEQERARRDAASDRLARARTMFPLDEE